MKNIKRKVSALVLTAVFASMQISMAALDTGLGVGNGGAVITGYDSNFAGMETGTNSATLNFTGNSHVNWNTLNVNANETMNFNAVNGATGVTVLNTVNQGMSNIYGQINANSGISNLIISNPNGVLFDGAKFTTAGDATVTTQNATLNAVTGAVTYDNSIPTSYIPNGKDYVVKIINSDFSVGGELNVIAPTMNVANSTFTANNGAGDIRFTTTNGQDYFVNNNGNCSSCGKKYTETQSMRLEAIKVDGDVYITSDKGIVETVFGGEINGDLNINSNGTVSMNYIYNPDQLKETDGKPIEIDHTKDQILHVTGDVNAKANGMMMYAKVTDVDGNLNMTNGGGYLEVNDVNVGKNMNLKTTNESQNPQGYKHFVHVNGETNVGGNVNIDSYNNIHIGNYKVGDKIYRDSAKTKFYYDGKLLDGEFNVGGDLTAKTTSGHIMTTVDVNVGNNVSYDANATSDGTRLYGGNILSDPNSVITAKTYQFSSDGYIGALKGFKQELNGKTYNYTTDQAVINTMEDYTFIPADTTAHDYLTIGGGTITKIETPKVSAGGNPVQVYIKSTKDVTLNGANTGDINLTAPQSKITITGDVHANNINVGPETNYLKLDFEGRDFTTNYTNIRDEKVVTIKPDEKITYELADGGYNQPTLKPTETKTYLIGPDKEPGPGPKPGPNPNPNPPNDDNVRVKNWVPQDPTAPTVNTPIAYAADLDDDEPVPCRKNVDGSVTVVRAYPMAN